MRILLIVVAVVLIAAIAALGLRALADRRALRREWSRLAEFAAPRPAAFDPALVADLPEPARRYLTWALRPGTPLARVAELEMTGQFGLGDKNDPKYQPMQAEQIIAPPHGFAWAMRTGGPVSVSGSDTGNWTRFSLFGLIPVARAGGTSDARRSAFGRELAEAAIWLPSALMPGPGVTWTAPGPDIARVTVETEEFTQWVDLTLAPDGAPMEFVLERWSNANPDKAWRLQPFGGVLSDHREIGGHRLPFHNEAGNHFGTEAYFPFFVADLTDVRFPGAD